MTDFENNGISPEEQVRQFGQALTEAVQAINPGAIEQGLTPLDVFPEPSERREDTPFEDALDHAQAAEFRIAMSKMGVGRETDEPAEVVGLPEGYKAIVEAGQGHKVKAELTVVAEGSVRPSVIVMPATIERILPSKEKELTSRVLGVAIDNVADNEKELVRQILELDPRFEAAAEERVLPLRYDIDSAAVSEDPHSEQMIEIGTYDGIPVITLDIERIYEGEPDEQGRVPYRQPGTDKVLTILDQVFTHEGDTDAPLGFVTSATYKPSRTLDTIRFGQSHGRHAAVITYGTAKLAVVKGEEAPTPPALAQLAGEAHKAAKVYEQMTTQR